MSASSVNGFDGVSTNSRRVLSRQAAAQAALSAGSTNVVWMPKRDSTLANRLMVEPNSVRAVTTWSPADSRAMTVARIADMPEAVATPHSAPSIAARRCSKARTVGFVNRE